MKYSLNFDIMRNYFSILFFFFLPATLIAQEPDEIINRYGSQNPIEKIYLHLDRDNYIAGQTAWFKAYQYADFLPGKNSTTIYVELLNGSSGLIERKILPAVEGTAHGQLELPDTLSGGNYFLRAYSLTMLNQDMGFVYTRRIYISGKNNKVNTAIKERADPVRIEFFPEGGNFVTGLSNTMAYKATNGNGLPATVSGLVKNNAGETVAEFSSYHDGMGFFDLVPQENKGYYAVLNGDPAARKYLLPRPSAKGIVLRVISSGNAKSFEVLQHTDDPTFKVAYMIGQMQHNTGFRINFDGNKSQYTGNIQTTDFFSGILHITAFNKEGMPLAERLTFVDNREYIQKGELLLDTLSFSEKGKNTFTISLKDTVQGSFSISVTDAAFETTPQRRENIVSTLLLTSDIKGYVHDPAYYFSADVDTVSNALDLVMMTNGWRRFKWTELLKSFPPPPVYKDPGYITLTGKVNFEGTKKPFADRDLLTVIVAADSSRDMQLVHTDAQGRYKLDSLMFFDKAKVFFSDPKGKHGKFVDVIADPDPLNKSYPLPPVATSAYPATLNPYSAAQQELITNDYDAIVKANGQLLKGITVMSKPKTKREEYEEKNISPLFIGGEMSTLSLLDKKVLSYPNILDYLIARLPGLEVRKERIDYSVKIRQQTSITGGHPAPTIYLDEAISDVTALASIPADQVAMVKVYSHFVAAPGGGYGGVLAVFTKKGSDMKQDIPSSGDVFQYKGYSVVKEFYAPDYSVDKMESKEDDRITLLWEPDIWLSDINPETTIDFYNNNRTKQYKIVMEGISSAGKMLRLETTVSAEKGGKGF